MKENTPIKKFRDQIRTCQDKLSVHWHSCGGNDEKIDWFGAAFTSFQTLKNMHCPRAKEDDTNDYELVLDRFNTHIDKHVDLWQRARVKYLDDFDPHIAFTEIERLNANLAEFRHEIKVYSSALKYFGEKAKATMVDGWKKHIESNAEKRKATLEEIDILVAKIESRLEVLSRVEFNDL